MAKQHGCEIFFGKVQLTGCERLEIKKKPNGLFYAFIEALYEPTTYKELSTLCWKTKREQFKVINAEGILSDFHCWGLIMELNTILKVDNLVRNHITIKMLNKVR